MKNFVLIFSFLLFTAALGQTKQVNPRPIDSSDAFDGKVLNQMERIESESDENTRQKMEDRSVQEDIDESEPGYDIPEEGYEEDVSW